jgi:hypothetical protein
VPFSQTLDTTEATTDAIDAEANADCGAPATEASVWYAFTPTITQTFVVDVSDSDYPAGAIVVTGAPGGFTLKSCGPGRIIFGAAAGKTYYILAFDDITGGTNGGTLQIAVTELPPPPEVHMTIDPVGHFDARTGAATVTGTLTCSGVVTGPVSVGARLTQQVGRFTISGFGSARLSSSACDGTIQPWTVTTTSQNGKFSGGRASVSASAFACGPIECSGDQMTAQIRLRR